MLAGMVVPDFKLIRRGRRLRERMNIKKVRTLLGGCDDKPNQTGISVTTLADTQR